MNRIIREQWGRWSLVLSLVWAGLVCAIFPAQQDASSVPEQASGFERLQVAYQPDAVTAIERVFPDGRAEDYRRERLYTWTTEPQPPDNRLPELGVPSRAHVRPVVGVLPDPGPSLEGTSRLPVEEKKGMPALPRITPGTGSER